MSLAVGRTKLVNSLKDLRAKWDRVREKWDDPVSRDFEDRFLGPLEGRTRAAVSAMEKMNDLVTRARRDCGQ